MSYFTRIFPPSFIAQIDGAIQSGRAASASVLGQPYTIYRNPTVTTGNPSWNINTSVMASQPIATGFPATIRRTTQKISIENNVFDLLVFIATCDRRVLQIQDVLQETGYNTDGGAFTFAQARPMRETLWIRTESACSITRPYPEGGAAAQMPASGAISAPAYGGIPKSNEQVLTLVNGFYDFASSGAATPATVQCGIQIGRRTPDGKSLGTPTDLYRGEVLVYIPDLPGVVLGELARINGPHADRYEIKHLLTTAQTGFTGQVAICEKLGV